MPDGRTILFGCPEWGCDTSNMSPTIRCGKAACLARQPGWCMW